MGPLDLVDAWDVDDPSGVAVAVVTADGVAAAHGPVERIHPWASVTKLVTAYATLVAAEEGALSLDEPAGPPGSTVRHLLAHASGLPFDGTGPTATPGTRRVYSNVGFDLVADHVAARTDVPFADYVREAVLEPLGMRATRWGSPAAGAIGPLDDLVALAVELLRPTLLHASTLATATAVQFPGLAGVLPGFGRQDPCDWGLGFELRDGKSPHWTGSRNSPATFGHFGALGSFLWVDPVAAVACCCLTGEAFGPWAATAWPALADEVLARHGAG